MFDADTEAAVRAFQRQFNLTPDGLVGPATWYRIAFVYNNVKRLSELNSEGLTLEEVSRQYPELLSEGMSGVSIRLLQYFLAIAGEYYDALPRWSAAQLDGIFGPFIGAVPSAILIMVTSPLQALYFVIFIIILQQIDGNILGPKILGNSTGLSSFWVMFAILIFGGLFGFVGMAIGVPLFAVIYSIVSECINHLLHNRGLSEDTNDYRGDKRLDAGTGQFVHVSSNVPPVSARERRAAAKAKEQSKTENNEKV